MACENSLIEGDDVNRFICVFAFSEALRSGRGHLLEGGCPGGRSFISSCALLMT